MGGPDSSAAGRAPVVSGRVIVPDDVALAASSVAYVDLVDVSDADAPSRLIDRQRIADVAGLPERGAIDFALKAEGIDPRRSYAVRAHVSVAGDGTLRPGDAATVQSYPVLTFGHPAEVTVATVKQA